MKRDDLPTVPRNWRAEQDKDLKDFTSYQYQVQSNMHSFWKNLLCALVVSLVSVGTLLMVFFAVWPMISRQFTWFEALGLAACCFCVIVPLQYLTRPGGRLDIWK